MSYDHVTPSAKPEPQYVYRVHKYQLAFDGSFVGDADWCVIGIEQYDSVDNFVLVLERQR